MSDAISQAELFKQPLLYWIYDHGLAQRLDPEATTLRAVLRRLAPQPLGLLQLRVKDLAPEAARHWCQERAAIIRQTAPALRLIMNDDARLAAELGCDGVHLGQDDGDPHAARALLGAKAIIGLTVRSATELRAARALYDAAVIDYIGAGTVYPTSTKPGLQAKGLDFIASVLADFPPERVFPIGGITPAKAPELYALGARHYALSSAGFAL